MLGWLLHLGAILSRTVAVMRRVVVCFPEGWFDWARGWLILYSHEVVKLN
jgi:hypothetical protein